MRKFLFFSILFLALVAALIGGFGGIFLSQHVGGKELWLKWKAERIAKGDRFEWRELTPAEVPDSENFARAPILAGAFTGKEPMDPGFEALRSQEIDVDWSAWQEGKRIDTRVIQASPGTMDLQTALARHKPVLQELDKASRRPHSRLPVDYSEGETPSYASIIAAVRMLCLRAHLQLSSGKSTAALDDLRTCLRIANHLKQEPSLLGSLFRQTILTTTMQVIWEGLEDHRWNDRQLQILQFELSHLDLLASSRLAWEGHRLRDIDMLTRAAETLPWSGGLQDSETEKPPRLLGILGKGWLYRNVLERDCFYVTYALEVIDPQNHRVRIAQDISPQEWYEQRKHRKDLRMALAFVAKDWSYVGQQAQLQSFLDQAVIVCALERYRAARGNYPDSLAQLQPGYLPAIPWDLTTGQPLIYRRQERHFQLYSQGWNLKDDRGIPGTKVENGKPVEDLTQGDWAWPHAKL